MPTASPATQAEDDLLVATFQLERGTFGLDTVFIQEVVMPGEVTPVRHAPRYVAGIRNLRGRIVTVIDLNSRLGLPPATLSRDSRILIVDWHGESVGLLVDRVEETVPVSPASLQPAPPNIHGVPERFLHGVFRSNERIAVLLEPAAVLAPERIAETLDATQP